MSMIINPYRFGGNGGLWTANSETLDQYATDINYWELSSTDAKAGGETLTNTGGVSFADAGIRNNCATFDGTAKKLATTGQPYNASGKQFFWSWWFNQAADMGSGVYAYGDIGNDSTHRLSCNVDNKRMTLNVVDGGPGSAVVIRGDSTPGDWNPSAGWHNCIVVNAFGKWWFFVDAVIDTINGNSPVVDSDTMPDRACNLTIGQLPWFAGYNYTGKLDEVSYREGSSIFGSESDVQDFATNIYNSGTGAFLI